MSDNNKISAYFEWKDALYLPQYLRIADESDGVTPEVKANLVVLFDKLDIIRDFFDSPILCHVAYRSPEYNKLVGGASKSAHLLGKAVDFHVIGVSCDKVRQELIKDGLLESMELRMEDLPGSNWVHIDTMPPNPNRFFKP